MKIAVSCAPNERSIGRIKNKKGRSTESSA
jgi:hypothetical protein